MPDRNFDRYKGIGTIPVVAATMRSVRAFYGYTQAEWSKMLGKKESSAGMVSKLESEHEKATLPKRKDILRLKGNIDGHDLDEILISAGHLPSGFDQIAVLINTDEDPKSFRRLASMAVTDVMSGRAPSVNTEAFQRRVQDRLDKVEKI